MEVYCDYHNQVGICSQEDYNDAQSGRNPSRMVRVQFKEFTQAVPFNTLHKLDLSNPRVISSDYRDRWTKLPESEYDLHAGDYVYAQNWQGLGNWEVLTLDRRLVGISGFRTNIIQHIKDI